MGMFRNLLGNVNGLRNGLDWLLSSAAQAATMAATSICFIGMVARTPIVGGESGKRTPADLKALQGVLLDA